MGGRRIHSSAAFPSLIARDRHPFDTAIPCESARTESLDAYSPIAVEPISEPRVG